MSILDNLDIEWDCNLLSDYLNNLQLLIINKYKLNISIDDLFVYISDKYNIGRKVQEISRIKQYKQLSPEWFNARLDLISASDIAAVFNVGYTSQKQLIEKKVLNNNTFKGNNFTRHGQKYEKIASIIYEKRNNKKIIEFVLIQHPKHSVIGASPDGITTDNIMIEIKCPSTRTINGIVPDNYGIQIQIQLETCDLEVCDFVEISVSEFNNEDEYLNNNNEFETGILIKALNYTDNEPTYFYPTSDILGNNDLLLQWRDNTINKYSNQFNNIKPQYWYIKQYSCVRVNRDKEWFNKSLIEITNVWDKILFYRKNLEQYHLDYPKKIRTSKKISNISSFHTELYSKLDNISNINNNIDNNIDNNIVNNIIAKIVDDKKCIFFNELYNTTPVFKEIHYNIDSINDLLSFETNDDNNL